MFSSIKLEISIVSNINKNNIVDYKKAISAILTQNVDEMNNIDFMRVKDDSRFNSNLLLMSFLYKTGIKKEYKDISDFYYHLRTNSFRHKLKDILIGKTIAVVGNGPQQMNKNTGEEIDSHDIVIRFNIFPTKGFSQDYGSKVDIWICTALFWNDSMIENFPEMLSIAKNVPYTVIYDIFHYIPRGIVYQKELLSIFLQRFKSNKNCFCSFDSEYKGEHEPSLGIKLPTLGLVLAEFLSENNLMDNTNFYGFTFLDEEATYKQIEYYSEAPYTAFTDKYHSLSKEAILVKKLIDTKHNV